MKTQKIIENIINKNINSLYNYKYVEDYNTNFTRLYETENFVNTRQKLFIPEDESKGIIARAIMHMSYEYKYDYHHVLTQ